MAEAYKQQLAKELKNKDLLEIKTVHQTLDGRTVMFEFDEESDGTRKLFSFAGPWLDSLKNGYVLFIDELHDNLHPKRVRFLIELFHNPETNPNNAQLVFTPMRPPTSVRKCFVVTRSSFAKKMKDRPLN